MFSLICWEMCRMDAVLMGTQQAALKPFCSEIFVHFPTTVVLFHLSPPFLGWRVNKCWTKWPIILTFHLCYSQKSLMVQKTPQEDNTHLHGFGIHTQPAKRTLYQTCHEYREEYMRQQRSRVLCIEIQEHFVWLWKFFPSTHERLWCATRWLRSGKHGSI